MKNGNYYRLLVVLSPTIGNLLLNIAYIFRYYL